MAKIIVPASLIQEHLDAEAPIDLVSFKYETRSSTFEWEQSSDYEEVDFDARFEVNKDIVFVTDDYIEREHHDQILSDFNKLNSELKKRNEQILQLLREQTELQEALERAKKPFWKLF